MLQINNLSFSIGDLNLLRNITWTIKPNRRIGLIGPNGAGKTTFLRILTNEYEPTGGSISIPKNYSIGYLPQEEIIFEEKSILDIVMTGNPELIQIEHELKNTHKQLDADDGNPALLKKLGLLEDRFSLLGGYQIESEAKKILSGLGFKDGDFDRIISEFSGGWRMRVHLCRLLLQAPDLLLMDEPTNHLDLSSLEWLEDYLQTFSGTIIIISHDRFFLDRLVNEIAEMDKGKITSYSGNYHFYEEKKELMTEQLIKAWQAQQEERARIQKFIDRFRYKNTKAAAVQSRVKMLEKMEIIEPPEQTSRFSFQIQADVKSFKEVLSISDLAFSYGENQVFKDFDLNIVRGEKLALVGDNGQGKTTLTRLIHKELIPQQGQLHVGERVNIGYYAQHQVDALDLNKTIYEEVEETAAPSFRPKLRDILGIFRFTGDDVNKKTGVLSGGEKARVSLAKILLSPCNFLIMDEPTNHLDMASKDALEHALRDYDGTLLVISHDRYFLDRLVKRVVEIKESKLYDYPGNYSYYLNKRKQYHPEEIENQVPSNKKVEPANVTEIKGSNSSRKSKEQKREEAEARKLVSKQRNVLQKRIDEIENKLDLLTSRKGELENQLADPDTYNDPVKGKELNKEYGQIDIEIPALEIEWEQKHLELEELLNSLQ
ncbi:MAG: ATP-binding cassette domain-containing protein [Calditrichaeota bacterium]|nr:MAG: ATP-binding cassette domain-containing protein [Calditrichota bacterium]MBL1205936.1 ATP-binding cassette domain-containing protein [Calditrichota bacterium]NOG45764.1 ABC-F family ATP-binding cassette domain-containing protein [Calditrichota bacterium]